MFRKSIVIHLEHCSFCSQQRCPFFHPWRDCPRMKMKMVVVVDFQNSTAMIEMSPKHRPNQQINPKWCHYTSPHDLRSIMCASPRNVIIPTPERKPHDLRSIMYASPRNVIIPTPERKPHDLRSIDHVCKSEERHHPHPTPPHPTPRETSRVRSIKHVCKCKVRHHPHPTPPHDLRSIDHVCKSEERHHPHPTPPHPTPPHPERNIPCA